MTGRDSNIQKKKGFTTGNNRSADDPRVLRRRNRLDRPAAIWCWLMEWDIRYYNYVDKDFYNNCQEVILMLRKKKKKKKEWKRGREWGVTTDWIDQQTLRESCVVEIGLTSRAHLGTVYISTGKILQVNLNKLLPGCLWRMACSKAPNTVKTELMKQIYVHTRRTNIPVFIFRRQISRDSNLGTNTEGK